MAVVWRGLTRIIAALLLGVTGSSVVKAQDPEAAAWDQAQRINTGDAFQNYLSEFPMGAHSQEAFTRMIRLTQIPDSPPADEPATVRTNRSGASTY
jgi:hypothetical protein